MTNKIKLVAGVDIPVDIVTQKAALIGRTGSGKSYGGTKLCEELLKINAQVVAIDPIGIWYGLRLSADGKGKGFPIVIFGGMYADIPITATSGSIVAKTIIEYGISAVLDVSMMRKNERKQFVTDFAEEFYALKKLKRTPVMVFLEEAQVFAPQNKMAGEERMLGAIEDLVKLGRNFGIGVTLISQRPQSVNKDCLNQTEALFAFQINGPHERKAIEDWIVDKGLQKKTVSEDLSGLNVGECFLWSPQWLRILKKVKILPKKTYDSSHTPKFGSNEKPVSRVLAAIDIEKITASLLTVIEEKKQNDPNELRKRIRELERLVNQKTKPVESVSPAKQKEVEHWKQSAESWKQQYETLFEFISVHSESVDQLKQSFSKINDGLKGAISVSQKSALKEQRRFTFIPNENEQPDATNPSVRYNHIPMEHVGKKKLEISNARPDSAIPSVFPINHISMEHVAKTNSEIRHKVISSDSNSTSKLGACERAILVVLAQRYNHGKHNHGQKTTTRAQAGILSGYAPKGGSFGNALSKLRTSGLITGKTQDLCITELGLNTVGEYDPLPTGSELHEYWINRIGKAEGEILKVLIQEYPATVSREELGRKTNREASGGSFGNALSRLRTMELIEGSKELKARDELFE